MRTSIKTLAIVSAVAATAFAAKAQDQEQRQEPETMEARCPACGRPLPEKVRRQKLQRKERKEFIRHKRQQSIKRFDFDGDGRLSEAERAARRAYREALREERGDQPFRPAPRPPIDE